MRRGNSRERGERDRAGSQLQESAAWKYHGAFLQISVALPVAFPPADRLGSAAVFVTRTGCLSRPMSVSGQKQTFAPQKAMSALPPIATTIAFFGTSALGQKRTHASQQVLLFDHLLGTSE